MIGTVCRLAVLLLVILVTTSNAAAATDAIIQDIFGRTVNGHTIVLVDWPGYMANPYVKLRLIPPTGMTYPIVARLTANGARLMFDTPSQVSATGPSKFLRIASADEATTFLMEIAPRREPGDEHYELHIHCRDANGRQSDTAVPIFVLNHKEKHPPKSPLTFDYRYDTIVHDFDVPVRRQIAERAMNDWFMYFDLPKLDVVPSGDETTGLPVDDWKGKDRGTNNAAYTGFWVFCRGIHGPHSTGLPSDDTFGPLKFQTTGGEPTPLHRSFVYIFMVQPGKPLFTDMSDDAWWEVDPRKVDDIYGITMHEFGHAVAYSVKWDGMRRYKASGGDDPQVVAYMGKPVPINDEMHIMPELGYIDRLSGQSGAWRSRFPVRRWMLTKLSLLIAQSAGWHLRPLSPFVPTHVTSLTLPVARRGSMYHAQLTAEGGVPFYDWLVLGGSLPPGLSLDRFTGQISGYPTGAAGHFDARIQLRDYDEAAKPFVTTLRLNVQ